MWNGTMKAFRDCLTKQEEAPAVCSGCLQDGWSCLLDFKEELGLPMMLPDPCYGPGVFLPFFLPLSSSIFKKKLSLR